MAKDRVRQESNRVPAKPDCVEPRRGPRQRRAANAEDDRVLAESARTEAERRRVLAEEGRVRGEDNRQQFESLRREHESLRHAAEEARAATIASVAATSEALSANLAQMQFLEDARNTLRQLTPKKPGDVQ